MNTLNPDECNAVVGIQTTTSYFTTTIPTLRTATVTKGTVTVSETVTVTIPSTVTNTVGQTLTTTTFTTSEDTTTTTVTRTVTNKNLHSTVSEVQTIIVTDSATENSGLETDTTTQTSTTYVATATTTRYASETCILALTYFASAFTPTPFAKKKRHLVEANDYGNVAKRGTETFLSNDINYQLCHHHFYHRHAFV